MSDWKEYSAKTVDEALTNALLDLNTTSDQIEYEVVEKESGGLLGLFSKPAKILVKVKKTAEDNATDLVNTFLTDVFGAMNLTAEFEIAFDETEKELNVDIKGADMGLLIGKRGQTLDSLQYLVSLVVNKESTEYIKVKVDTEDYRRRRKETLENLARNIASRVKRTHKTVALEPMNSFERRIIHSALQNDNFVETHSEGEEPYRKVLVTPKKGSYDENSYKKPYRKNYGKGGYNKGGYGKGRYNKGGYNKGGYNKSGYNKPYNSERKNYNSESRTDVGTTTQKEND